MPAPIEGVGDATVPDPPVFLVEGISKSFGAVQALKDVSLSLARREIRAICGENGAGKSTLVKVLMGLVQPDAGTIRVNGEPLRINGSHHAQSLGFGLVSQEFSLAPHLSIFDNIWLGSPETPFFHRRSELREKALRALETLGVTDWKLDDPVARLGIAQRQIVEIARLIARQARLLILDEPTATLNDSEIERIMTVLRNLRQSGCSVLYVSHRLGEVFDLCDSVSVFRNGRHIATSKTQDISRADLIAGILGRSMSDMYPPAGETRTAAGAELSVRNLTIGRQVQDLSFDARRGEILCIAGQIGSGANLVPRALAGLAADATGRLVLDGRPAPLRSVAASIAKSILYISDDRAKEGLFQNLSVLDNLVASTIGLHAPAGLIRWSRLRDEGRARAQKIGLDASRLVAPAGALSGGNQQKILFGRILRSGEPGLLLLNEPTRGIDVGARAELYRIMRSLCAQGYVLIMYSSDIEEVVGMADVVITLYRGRAVRRYERAEIDGARILADITHPAATAA